MRIRFSKKYKVWASDTGRVFKRLTMVFVTRGGHAFKEFNYGNRGCNGCYVYISLPKENGRQKKVDVHRIVAAAFLDNPYDLPIVLHKDDDPSNNHLSNLMWGTQFMNIQDMILKNRHEIICSSPSRKKISAYIRDKIPLLVKYLDAGLLNKQIAVNLNLSESRVSQILMLLRNSHLL
jgi:hypothetical protein